MATTTMTTTITTPMPSGGGSGGGDGRGRRCCSWRTWCSAALGSPWQRPFGVPLALVAAVIGGGRVVYLGPGGPVRGIDRRRHRPGGRLRRGGLPGRVLRRRRGRLHRPGRRVPGSLHLRARPARDRQAARLLSADRAGHPRRGGGRDPDRRSWRSATAWSSGPASGSRRRVGRRAADRPSIRPS